MRKTPKVHALKCWPEYFEPVLSGEKRFELRKNDRDFQNGDILLLCEWDQKSEAYTGRQVEAEVVYMTAPSFGIAPDYVLMSIIARVPSTDEEIRLRVENERLRALIRNQKHRTW